MTTTCVPSSGPSDSLVTSPRILAVRAVPAEATPGTDVAFTAFVVGPSGAAGGSPTWSFCTAPLPLTEDNAVSNACLGSSALVAAGTGVTTTAATPQNGCSLFGPDTPPGNFRPVDPDATGGYYQPLRADLAGAADTFALARIKCDLGNADAAAASAFASAYKANLNPTLLPVTAAVAGEPVALDALPAGARVVLTAAWSPSDAETFAYFDPSSQQVTTQREAMQVAWYSTAGSLDTESTGRSSIDLATTTSNGWLAPSAAGMSHLFVVLRDSRGGVDFADVELSVR